LAQADMFSCKTMFEVAQNDIHLNIAGYHLQQAVEKALKFRLGINGIDYRLSATFGILTHENYIQKIQFIFCK